MAPPTVSFPSAENRRISLRRRSFIAPTVNPFSYSQKLDVVQKIKIAIAAVTIMPIRLICLIIVMLLMSLFAFISVYGLSVKQLQMEPIKGWRRKAQWPLPFFNRMALFFLGFHYVKTKGKLATAKEAPLLVVAPHSSFADFFPIVAAAWPSAVSKLENSKIPIIGNIIRSVQPIFVDRLDPNSRKKCLEDIKERVTSNGKWQQVMIFPEGTTTNRQCLVTFKNGAFVAGVPVQPVALKYPNLHFDPAWVLLGPSGLQSLFLMLCQLVNHMEIEYLPVYTPSEEEKRDPTLFANNVRNKLAVALGIPVTDHSFEDVQLMSEAAKHQLPMETGIVEYQKISRKLGINLNTINDMLQRFKEIDRDGDGEIDLEEFAEYLNLPVSRYLEKLFELYDRDESGKIDFREYLIGLSLVSRPANTEDTIRLAFKTFDEQGTGCVTQDGLAKILRRAFPYISDQEIRVLFTSVHGSRDGVISFDEFQKFMSTHLEYASLVDEIRQAHVFDQQEEAAKKGEEEKKEE